jgi:hypothetical protein
MRRDAERIGMRVLRVPRHPGRFLVLDEQTCSVLSPTLVGLEQVERWLRVAHAERALEIARRELVAG